MATAKNSPKVAKKATAKKTSTKTTAAALASAAIDKIVQKEAPAKKAAPKKTAVVKKVATKKAAKKGVVVVKEVRAPKPVKPGVPAKPKKSAAGAIVTQPLAANNISLTVAELEAKINAVEGTGTTPRLVVLRRPTDAIMASIGVQNSVYTDTTRPASPARTLVALNARLASLNLRSTEWYVRDLF